MIYSQVDWRRQSDRLSWSRWLLPGFATRVKTSSPPPPKKNNSFIYFSFNQWPVPVTWLCDQSSFSNCVIYFSRPFFPTLSVSISGIHPCCWFHHLARIVGLTLYSYGELPNVIISLTSPSWQSDHRPGTRSFPWTNWTSPHVCRLINYHCIKG